MTSSLSEFLQTWNPDKIIRMFQHHPELIGQILERILDQDADLTWSLAVNLYLDEEISLSKTAELIGEHPLVLRKRFIELGIPIRSGPSDLPEAIAEVQAARNWIAASTDTTEK